MHTKTSHPELYAAAATDGSRHAALLVHYSVDRNAAPRAVQVELAGASAQGLRCYLLDEHHTMQELALPESGEVLMPASSVLLVADFSVCHPG